MLTHQTALILKACDCIELALPPHVMAGLRPGHDAEGVSELENRTGSE